MAFTITVADMIINARQRANMESTNFVTDAEIVNYLDRAWRELYDLITSTAPSNMYFLSSTTINITSNVDTYALPTDFYKLKGIDLPVDPSAPITLMPFNFNERNRGKNSFFNINATRIYRYLLAGNNLKFIPTPSTTVTATLWYVPIPPKLSTIAGVGLVTSIDSINGWDEYITTDAAIQMLAKEESDTSNLRADKAERKELIIASCVNRDEGFPQHVTDISSLAAIYPFSQWLQ